MNIEMGVNAPSLYTYSGVTMQVSGITERDGLEAAHLAQFIAVSMKLIDALELAGMPISAPGLEHRKAASKWYLQLTRDMATDIQRSKTQVRVKSTGTTGTGKKKAGRKGK